MRHQAFGVLLALLTAPAMAQQSLDLRMDRAERQLNTLAEMAQGLRAAREEIQRLNGALEELRHEQKQLEQRQTTLYSDLEQRLQTAPAALSAVASKDAPVAAANEDKEWPAYKAAYDLLRESQYAEAEKALSVFLKDFPAGQYAGHAQYWLGESFYVRGKYEQALTAFRALQNSYPQSPKAEAGQLKEAFSMIELKQADAARVLLEKLGMSRDADLAKRARERLKSLP